MNFYNVVSTVLSTRGYILVEKILSEPKNKKHVTKLPFCTMTTVVKENKKDTRTVRCEGGDVLDGMG